MRDPFAIETLNSAACRADLISGLLVTAEEAIGDVLSDDPHMRQLVGRTYDLVQTARMLVAQLSGELSRFAAEAERRSKA